jgi:4-hydroxybenzoyl-CoA reductase subunit beta
LSVACSGAVLGAAVTLAELIDHGPLARAYPALVAAARSIAAPAHREAATLGGNLCLDTRCLFYNQSAWWRGANGFCLKYGGDTCHVAPTGTRCHAAYSGDLAAILMVYGALVEIAGSAGLRVLPLGELYADDGAAHLRLARDECVMSVRLPPDPPRARYEKARPRRAIDFPLAGVAVGLRVANAVVSDLRVALTGTNSRPLLLEGCEAFLGAPLDEAALDRLGKLVQRQVSPMRTTLLSSNYRRRVAVALTRRLALELLGPGWTPEAISPDGRTLLGGVSP